MSREILEQFITKQNDGSFDARVEFIEDGERQSRKSNRPTFEEANAWVVSIEDGREDAPGDTVPEPANMSVEDAERINSNVVPPTAPNGAESVPNGQQAGADDSELTAADTQPAPSDHDTSNEVNTAQDPTAVAHNSSNKPEEQGSDTQSPAPESDSKSDDNSNTATEKK